MTYKYLYQDRDNKNHEGEIKARNRAEAYAAVRKLGIRPYRVIGDDPVNWKPWAIAAGYVLLTLITIAALVYAVKVDMRRNEVKPMSEVEKFDLRMRCIDEVLRAPEFYRDRVLEIMNERLAEKGIKELSLKELFGEDE